MSRAPFGIIKTHKKENCKSSLRVRTKDNRKYETCFLFSLLALQIVFSVALKILNLRLLKNRALGQGGQKWYFSDIFAHGFAPF